MALSLALKLRLETTLRSPKYLELLEVMFIPFSRVFPFSRYVGCPVCLTYLRWWTANAHIVCFWTLNHYTTINSLPTADVFPVIASLPPPLGGREATTGSTFAVCRLNHKGPSLGEQLLILLLCNTPLRRVGSVIKDNGDGSVKVKKSNKLTMINIWQNNKSLYISLLWLQEND